MYVNKIKVIRSNIPPYQTLNHQYDKTRLYDSVHSQNVLKLDWQIPEQKLFGCLININCTLQSNKIELMLTTMSWYIIKKSSEKCAVPKFSWLQKLRFSS